MGLIIDTSLIVAAERGKFDLQALLSSRLAEGAVLSAITASELLVGVHRASPDRVSARAAFVENCLSTLTVIPFDLGIARVHAQLTAELFSRGVVIGPHDLLIAATAVYRGDSIATRDARSFPRVPGLKVELL